MDRSITSTREGLTTVGCDETQTSAVVSRGMATVEAFAEHPLTTTEGRQTILVLAMLALSK
jgi:hypothetical protein